MFQGISEWSSGVRGRLLVATLITITGYLILGVSSMTNLKSIVSISTESFNVNTPKTQVIGKILETRGLILYDLWAAVGTFADPIEQKKYVENVEKLNGELKTLISTYEKFPMDDDERKAYESLRGDFKIFYDGIQQMVSNVKNSSPETLGQTREMLSGDWQIVSSKISQDFEEQQSLLDRKADRQSKEFSSIVSNVEKSLLIVGLLAIVLSGGILIYTANLISKKMTIVTQSLDQATSEVSTAVHKLSETGGELANGSNSSAASLEETVASLEELTSMVRMNSDNAKQAATLSITSKTAAERGEHEIKNLVGRFSEISESSKKIEDIINVIDDIAFQTNLLALNASVEAARAGEHGKGFAVVADAVRTLAQRASSAAKDISTLIKDSVSKVESGNEVALKSGDAMNEILNAVKKVSDLSNEIASASSEQTNGIQQISQAMNTLDQAVQSNAASAGDIANTTGGVHSRVEVIHKHVRDLNELVFGQKKAS